MDRGDIRQGRREERKLHSEKECVKGQKRKEERQEGGGNFVLEKS